MQQTQQIEVLIPLGVTQTDIEKMAPITNFLPRPLIPIKGKPILWYIFNQLSEIEAYVGDVHLLITEMPENSTWEMLKKENLLEVYNFDNSTGNWPKLKEKIFYHVKSSSETLTQQIVKISNKLNGAHFLIHFPDIILPPTDYQNIRNFYMMLIAAHMGSKDARIGTFACSRFYPMGFGILFADANGMVSRFWEKTILTDFIIKSRINVRFNIAVSVFDREKLVPLLKDKKSNDLYAELASLIQEKDLCFFQHCFDGNWFHADTIYDLYNIEKSL